MGTGTTHDQPDNSRRDDDPPLGRDAVSEGDDHLATGGRLGQTQRRFADRPARRSRTRTGRAIRTAPNPGTSWRWRARRKRRPMRALGRRANGTGALARTAGDPRRKARARMPEASSPAAEEGCDAARREVSTGTN
jgi:hypothetical protein